MECVSVSVRECVSVSVSVRECVSVSVSVRENVSVTVFDTVPVSKTKRLTCMENDYGIGIVIVLGRGER